MPVSRRAFALSLAAAAAKPQSARLRRRPNVLAIVTEGLGYGDLSSNGNPHLRTPALDRLATEGAAFLRFSAGAEDAGTRASLLTGRYSLRSGVYGGSGGRETLPAAETTIAEALRNSGYRTAYFGKWHLGRHYPNVPHAQGFLGFTGFRGGQVPDGFEARFERNGRSAPAPAHGYLADAVTDEALRFLDTRQEPFFALLSYSLPGTPGQVPEPYWQRFRNLELAPATRAAYALTACLDGNIARVLKKIDVLEIAGGTIVVFVSASGPATQRFSAGLRGAPASMYEAGTRVPLLIRWPGHVLPGRRIEIPAAPIDLYPTLLDLCHGAQPGDSLPIDGVSLVPLLTEEEPHWPGRTLIVQTLPPGDTAQTYRCAVLTERFSLVHGNELYDLANDSGQQTDTAAQFPNEAARMRTVYQAWLRTVTPRGGFHPPPIPVGYEQEDTVVLTPAEAYPHGAVHFRAGAAPDQDPFEHDWFTGWGPADLAHWDLDVVRAGRFEVSVRYLCPPAAVGARLEVSAGRAAASAPIATAAPPEPLPVRDTLPRQTPGPMPWQTLTLGTLELPKGKQRLELRVTGTEDTAALHTDELTLRRQ